MILQFTLKCDQECKHCMVSARCDSTRQMTDDTFTAVLEYLSKLSSPHILISGGEFSLHPSWYEYSLRILSAVDSTRDGSVTFLTNGNFLLDRLVDRRNIVKLLDHPRVVGLQVGVYKNYHPNYDRIVYNQTGIERLHRKIIVSALIEPPGLMSLGRAKDNCIPPHGRKYPSCSNTLLTARQVRSWDGLHNTLSIHRKFCLPLITPEGAIHIGESPDCRCIGSVRSSFEDLLYRASIVQPCGYCGLSNPFDEECYKNLSISLPR